MSVVKIEKYDYIDSLRGLAILMVVIVHVSQRVLPVDGSTFERIVENGNKGVQLFFMISALTLCFSLNSRLNKESRPILYFFIRRYLRIAPLFYLAIIFYQFPFDLHANYYAPNGIKPWYILSTATFTHAWHPETYSSIVPGGWSIAVEFTFYLFLPFLFKLINNKEKAILFFVFVSFINYPVSEAIRHYWAAIYPENQYYLVHGTWFNGFFNQLPVFAIGILLYQLLKDFRFTGSKFTSVTFIILAFFFMLAYTSYDSWHNYISQLAAYCFAFGLLTFALANRPLKLFVNPLSKHSGKVSYSMYIIHFAVIEFFTARNFFGLSSLGNSGTVIAIVIVFAISVLLATITYNYIEKPGIALGTRIITRLEKKAVLKPVVVSVNETSAQSLHGG